MTARPTSSLVTQDVVLMAAVRALPVDLLRALQEAELCDPGVLLAYPRGRAESLGLAPQSSGRRIVSKSQGAQSRPDPTLIDGMHATGIDIVSYPIVSIASYPVGGSVPSSLPVPGSVPVVSLSEESVSRGPKNLKPKIRGAKKQIPPLNCCRRTTRRAHRGGSRVNPLKNYRRMTARRQLRGATRQIQHFCRCMARRMQESCRRRQPFPRSSGKAKNSREGRQSASQPDEFSPRVDAPISATSGQVLSFTRSEQLEQTPANQIAETDLDACLLYRTLVKDGAIPEGWETDFMNLVKVVRQPGDRQLRAFSQVKNEDASVWLHEYHERRAIAERKEKQEAAQCMAAWEMKPRRYKTKFQRSLYAGPTARRDAEEAERTRWIHELSLIVSGTPTPIARQCLHVGSRPQSFNLALQSPIAEEVFLVAGPLSQGCLSIGDRTSHRLLEGEALRTVQPSCTEEHKRSFCVLERGDGHTKAQRPTSRELYRVVFRELLSTALPGRPAKQAPRMLVSMLEALETLVACSDVAPYLRVYG